MKKLIITLFLIVAIIPASYASDTLEFNIVGKILATTCNIKTANQTVNLGSWQATSTSGIGSGVGSKSPMVGFNLDFDCAAGLKVNAQLEGNQHDVSDMYAIGLDNNERSAKGVYIEIHYYTGAQWKSLVYGDVRTIITNTIDGINSLSLRAFYYQYSAPITPGLANSSVTLTITYQ